MEVGLIIVFLLCTASVLLSAGQKKIGIQELVANTDYNKNIRPYYNNGTVDVKIQLLISTLGPIDERDMTFELSFYLRQWWHDPRLANNRTINEITSNAHPGNTIWIPDIYIVNVRQVTYFTQFTRTIIESDGSAYFSQKIAAKCTCPMDLATYPMDEQKCGAQFESYAYSTQDLRLKWHPTYDGNVPEKEQLSLTGYVVTGVTKSSRDIKYGEGKSNLFENLFMHFHVKRTSVYYAYKGFLPTITLTMLNLGSYWIPDNAMPARVTLIITTFLANMLILQSVSEQTVKVSYTTAMQLFLLVNVIFLMMAIAQYLVLLNLKKRNEERQQRKKKKYSNARNQVEVFSEEKNDTSQHQNGVLSNVKTNIEATERTDCFTEVKRDNVHILDSIFRILMPFLYFLFCAVYFGYYLG